MDPTTRASLKGCGCSDDDCDNLDKCCTGPGRKAGAGAFDWSKIVALITTYGPTILPIILALFGGGALPTPLPALTPTAARKP